MKPLISCVIPVWNCERYVAEAIESVLAQTYRPLELVVVDDGSTDATAGVVARYAGRLRACFQPNAGAPAARNHGIREARGELLALLDADDVWEPVKLERQAARFAVRPELGVSLTHARLFWCEGMEEEEERFRSQGRLELPGLSGSTFVARRSLFESVGLFDAKLRHRDSAEWFARTRTLGVITEILSEPLVRRRMHPRNMSRIARKQGIDEFLGLVKASLDRDRSRSTATLPLEPRSTAPPDPCAS